MQGKGKKGTRLASLQIELCLAMLLLSFPRASVEVVSVCRVSLGCHLVPPPLLFTFQVGGFLLILSSGLSVLPYSLPSSPAASGDEV